MTDTIHNFDTDGFYTGPALRPLDPVAGVPAAVNEANATLVPPPNYDPSTHRARYVAGAWLLERQPEPEPPVPPEEPTPPDPRGAVLAEIVALEASNPITHRALRETILAVGQIAAQLTGHPMESNPAISRILELEAQIDALRDQL